MRHRSGRRLDESKPGRSEQPAGRRADLRPAKLEQHLRRTRRRKLLGEAAEPDSTLAPDLFDADNILMAAGGRFALTETLFLTASYTQIQYLNRNNTGKSTLNTLSNGTPLNLPTLEMDGGGEYTQWVGVFTGNLEAMF